MSVGGGGVCFNFRKQKTGTNRLPLSATIWAAEFLLREGERRECLGSWINSSAVHEAKKRRAKQVITCSFPCGKWLHMIGARASPGCELCKRERRMDTTSTDALPIETVAHIQSAGCKAQKKSVIRAHNRCWEYLRGANSTHVEAKRRERECCLLVLNLVSSTLPCIRQPRPRLQP